ncbi:MAG: type II toxin-antitoxin system VapC family toxin [Ilumatobacteraceae bacterium]
MILPDVNVLVYAHRHDALGHVAHAHWLTSVAEGGESFSLSAATVAGFVRIVTHPRIFEQPTATTVAFEFLDALAASPSCRWLEPADRWSTIFADLCRKVGARGNLVPDAALAALAIEHHCRLASADTGFARFPGLSWFRPTDE